MQGQVSLLMEKYSPLTCCQVPSHDHHDDYDEGDDHDERDGHDHDHTCCQVPSHVSDAGPGARVVAALNSRQLFAFRQSVNNEHDEDGNVIYPNKSIHSTKSDLLSVLPC